MPKDKSTGKKLADMLYGNPERAAFGVFPQLGRRGQAKPAPRQADKPFIDERAMELPQFGDLDLDVPTAANRAMGQRMVERDVDLKRQADRDMSPLEKLAGGIQAGRLIGSGLTQAVKSIPTAISKGSKAAEDYIAENIYQPTQPKAYEYAGNIADFLTSLESDYKIPPIIPEAMVFQNLVGPATRQAGKAVKQGAKQGALNLAAPRTLNPQAGVFIGPKAKTFHQGRADMAVAMEEAGRTPQEIWLATGTFRGADGILRQEIDDRAAKFLSANERQERIDSTKGKIAEMKEKIKPTPQKDLFPKALTEAKKEVRDDISILKSDVEQRQNNPRTQGLLAQHIFEHPELYAAYPELQNVKIVTEGGSGGGARGSLSIMPSRGFYPGSMEMDIYDKGLRSNPTSTALHEMQHAVQTLEGMGPGGNPTFAFSNPEAHEILKKLREETYKPSTFEQFQRVNKFPEDEAQAAYEQYLKERKANPITSDKVERAMQETAAMEYYKRLLGEAEARAVQDRQMMTPAQRMETPPPASYDVPQEDLIVKPPREYADGGRVHFSDNPDVMMLELQAGGLVKRLAKGVQNVLPAAEREANKAKFLEPSKVPQRLYHGTTATEGGKGQEAIRRIKPSKEGALGSGVYLTPRAAHASGYSGIPNDEALALMAGDPYAKKMADQFMADRAAGTLREGQEGGNMLPVFAQMRNPLILEGKGDPMIEALTKLGMDEDKAARMVERAYENKGYIGKEVETRARAAGYDGLMQYRDGDLSEVVSYNPNAVKSAIGNQGTYDINDPDLNKAAGGAIRMQVGGLAKLGTKGAAKGAKPAKKAAAVLEKELTLPSKLPRATPRTKEDLRPHAQQMAEATRGDFYRPDPAKSVNPAGKSFEQFKMEQGLVHDIRPTAKFQTLPRSNIEDQKGMVKMGISGDTTVAEQVLHEAGPYALDLPSPQHGGALYGLGGEGAWASNNPIAKNVQERINEISQAYGDAPVLGQYMQMGKLGSDFALHFADANLRAIDLSKMSKGQIESVDELIRKGSKKSGARPSFPGIEDKESAYLHFAVDPELRKHFNAIMQKPTYTEPLGLPDGRIIHHAITEPELRSLPVTTTGFSQMELQPGFDPLSLELSAHPTYSHVIPHKPNTNLTRTRVHIPAPVEFSDVTEYLLKTGPRKYDASDMTRMYQTATPRQIIDQQHIDEIKMFEELMKEYGGKKAGGGVKAPAAQIDGNKFVLAAQKYGLGDDMTTLNKMVSLVNRGATVDEAARVVAGGVRKAAGGEITADDLILEERKL
jgi:hypothetical protein